MSKAPPLFKHQKQSGKLLDTTDRVFDMSDPGTGKTRVHAEGIARRRDRGAGPAIVFAPKSILQSAWGNDLERFVGGMKYVIARAENRKDAFDETADIYITNLDAATWLADQKDKFWKRFTGGQLIIDESTAYKHHTSKRSKAVAKIRKYFPIRRNLSGAPHPNGMCDLWHQAYLLDDGKRLGSSFYQFRASVCQPEQIGPQPNHVKWTDRPGAEMAVSQLLRDISIRHVLEECIDMPENVEYPMEYVLPSKHYAYYLKMEADSKLMVRDKKVTAINGAVLYGKLLQIASGAVYDENGDYVVLDTGRYELIADLIEQRPHSVVMFQWNHQRDLLIAELEKRDIRFAVIDGNTSDRDRTDITDYFQRGFYRALLAHPKSAAHGFTWTRGTSTIWPSPTINLEWWVQGNRRIYRAGQTQRTETIVVVAKGTTDEKVFASLTNKNMNMTALLAELAA